MTVNLLGVAEAQARLLALAAPLAPERVPLGAALGRWAAEAIPALRTQPAADLSAMDGYAIRFAELPGPWRVIGESAAGAGFAGALAAGEAVRIFTGAPLPTGSDSILVQEEADRDGERLTCSGEGPPRRGAHVRPRGSDFAAETIVIAAGARLTPARIALAAAGGHGLLGCRRRARVALISTGDELVLPGAATPADRLPASNGPMLAAMLAALPVDVTDFGIIPDRLDEITAALQAASSADVVVTIGGASVGDRDLVRPALAQAGATLDFWRVAMKPGKPLIAGRLGDAVLLGLPGNPVSAFVTAQLFLLPLLRALMGAADPLPRPRRATLAQRLTPTGSRAEYLRASWQGEGILALTNQDSAALSTLAAAEALIVRPAGSPAAAAGDSAEFLDIA